MAIMNSMESALGGLNCELHCHSSGDPIEQVYTGFRLLHEQGLLRVKIKPGHRYEPGTYSVNLLEARVEVPGLRSGQPLRLFFDVDDQWRAPDDLRQADYYFSRSGSSQLFAAHPRGNRVLPMGLSYPVYSADSWPLQRALWAMKGGGGLKSLIRHVPWLARLFQVQSSAAFCQTRNFEGRPRIDAEPRILLMTQTWDPGRVSDQAEREDRLRINEMRAECIRAMRHHFPGLFYGGLRHSPHAVQHHPDCLLPDGSLSKKWNYLKLMHASSICIATTGLLGSTGWRFAEYVAAAKAIVTEPLLTAPAGPLCEGVNYSTFQTPQECVELAGSLVDSPQRRLEMMRANLTYYHGYLRPDMLVWNAITTAILRELADSRQGAAPQLAGQVHP